MQSENAHPRFFAFMRATMLAAFLFTAAALGGCTDLTGPNGADPRNDTLAQNGPNSSNSTSKFASSYVATNGSSQNDGSKDRPWSLEFALSGANGAVRAGDTIWVRGGTYKGTFRSTLQGATGRPIVVRQFDNERAVIDGAGTPSTRSVLRVEGDWTTFWGLEFTNSAGGRSTSSTANNVRANVVTNDANHTKYINLIIHDGGVGFYNEPAASDVEVAGCIIFNNGWQGPDRGHGHALYLKSVSGPLTVRENIVFNQFGYGIHAYTNEGSGKLNNIRLEGNVSFNNGLLSNRGTAANILVGGEVAASGNSLRNNFTWYPRGDAQTNVKLGYQAVRNGSIEVSSNYFVGGGTVLDVGYWNSASIQSNTLVGSATMVRLNDRSARGQNWRGNAFNRDPESRSWSFGGASYSFQSFRSESGVGSGDAATDGEPRAPLVFVRENPHERGRAHIIVYNWSRTSSVPASLEGVVPRGARYAIHNAQNIFGSPVAGGKYEGEMVTLPAGGVSPPAPIAASSRAPRTGPYFDVFVVRIAR